MMLLLQRLSNSGIPVWMTCLVTVTAWGCSGAAPASLPSSMVAGKVTLDKEPVISARVRFIPIENTKGFGGFAVTNSRGQYMIDSSGAPGATGLPEGKYKVVIESFRIPEDPNLAAKFKSPEGKPTTVPAIYTKDTSTPLEAIVMSGGGPQDFDLVSKK